MEGTPKHRHPGKLPLRESIELLLKECEKKRREVLDRGPWDNEPDYQQFDAHGFHCIVSRNPLMFNWCGYVGVPPGHPAYGKPYSKIDDIDVHGGLTFSSECGNHICHPPAPGEPDQLWWLGFDCGHWGDVIPGNEAILKKLSPIPPDLVNPLSGAYKSHILKLVKEDEARKTYKTYDFVMKETIYLAEQLKVMGETDYGPRGLTSA